MRDVTIELYRVRVRMRLSQTRRQTTLEGIAAELIHIHRWSRSQAARRKRVLSARRGPLADMTHDAQIGDARISSDGQAMEAGHPLPQTLHIPVLRDVGCLLRARKDELALKAIDTKVIPQVAHCIIEVVMI